MSNAHRLLERHCVPATQTTLQPTEAKPSRPTLGSTAPSCGRHAMRRRRNHGAAAAPPADGPAAGPAHGRSVQAVRPYRRGRCLSWSAALQVKGSGSPHTRPHMFQPLLLSSALTHRCVKRYFISLEKNPVTYGRRVGGTSPHRPYTGCLLLNPFLCATCTMATKVSACHPGGYGPSLACEKHGAMLLQAGLARQGPVCSRHPWHSNAALSRSQSP